MATEAVVGVPELNVDVLSAIAQALSAEAEVSKPGRDALLSCCTVCRLWHRTMRLAVHKDPHLLRAHFHDALGVLVEEARPGLRAVRVRGPRASSFPLAPALTLSAPLTHLAKHSSLQSLSLSGHFANAVYRDLNGLLPPLAHTLTHLSVRGVHQLSHVMSSQQVLELPVALPLLEVLEIPLMFSDGSLGADDQSVEDWCTALRGLTRLSNLRRLASETPLYHLPALAEAVKSWSALPRLRELELDVQELLNPWLDPGSFKAQVWAGVLPQLSQLTSLQLKTDEVPQVLWADIASCSRLQRLELRHTSWGLDFDVCAQPLQLHSLQRLRLCLGNPALPALCLPRLLTGLTMLHRSCPQSLRLCLGDAALSALCLPRLRTSLTTLHLELKGMDYAAANPVVDEGTQAEVAGAASTGNSSAPHLQAGAAGAASSGSSNAARLPAGLAALAPLAALRRFSCDAKSCFLLESDLECLGAAWSLLDSFTFKGPCKVTSGRGLAQLQHLHTLELLSRDPGVQQAAPRRERAPPSRCVHVVHLPPSLTHLALEDATLLCGGGDEEGSLPCPASPLQQQQQQQPQPQPQQQQVGDMERDGCGKGPSGQSAVRTDTGATARRLRHLRLHSCTLDVSLTRLLSRLCGSGGQQLQQQQQQQQQQEQQEQEQRQRQLQHLEFRDLASEPGDERRRGYDDGHSKLSLLSALAAAAPCARVLRGSRSGPHLLHLAALRDEDLEPLTAGLAHSLEELEMAVSGVVTVQGLTSLARLRCLRTLQLHLGSERLAEQCRCLTALTQLRSLALLVDMGPSPTGMLTLTFDPDKLASALRAGMPDTSIVVGIGGSGGVPFCTRSFF